MYKMRDKNFLLQTLLLPLVLLSGHEYGETRQLALTPDAPSSRLLGEAIPGNSTDTTWNLIGPPGSRLHLNCTDQTLLKSANCSEGSLSIFENGEEEKVWSKGQSTVYSRQSEGNQLTVRIQTEPSTCSGGRVSCDISLMKGSPLTDSEDYMDDNIQNDLKTSNPNEGTERKRLVMGSTAPNNEYSFMAAITIRLSGHTVVRCGGTIITQRHILTASSCIDNSNTLWVIAGAPDLNKAPRERQTLPVLSMHPHQQEDLAVFLLQTVLVFGLSVKQVYLPSFQYQIYNNLVKALGWGEMFPTGEPSSVLKFGYPEVANMDLCRRQRPYDIKQNQICLKGERCQTCKRDTGGPLVLWDGAIPDYVQVGLINDWRDCGNWRLPRLHTALRGYVPWIEDIVWRTVPGLTCKKFRMFQPT